jgi:hypothetical protein
MSRSSIYRNCRSPIFAAAATRCLSYSRYWREIYIEGLKSLELGCKLIVQTALPPFGVYNYNSTAHSDIAIYHIAYTAVAEISFQNRIASLVLRANDP